MNKNVIYVGIDVDDNSFHVSAFLKESGELIEKKSKPTVKSLENVIKDLEAKFPDHKIQACYEATYLGFSLHRDITNLGYECFVVAPSSIPRVHGNQVKTDRVDAGKLAQFLAAGILTFVTVPDIETEKDRDFMRSRQFIMHQISELRTHIQSLLRRNGLHYKSETGHAAHWTKLHLNWLDRQIEVTQGSLQSNLKILLQQMKWCLHSLNEYDKGVDELAVSDKYKNQVNALICYHGIKNIWAMVIITEIGNIKRFKHPNQMSSWMGFDIREYSSGGKHNRFGITKHGNKYLRNALVEANQRFARSKPVGRDLKYRRNEIDPTLVLIAERCRMRLMKKGNRMLHAGKHANKVKVAMAREMVGFVWESLSAVAA